MNVSDLCKYFFRPKNLPDGSHGLEVVRVYQDIGSTHDAHVAFSIPKTLDCLVQRHKRRRAARINSHTGSTEIEEMGYPVRSHRSTRAGQEESWEVVFIADQGISIVMNECASEDRCVSSRNLRERQTGCQIMLARILVSVSSITNHSPVLHRRIQVGVGTEDPVSV